MPRPPRVHMEGVLYYVTSRVGGAAGLLFKNERDYGAYLSLLNSYHRQFGFRLYTFLLMPDQVHLVIEPTGGKTVSEIMHDLNSRYSKFFTRRYGQPGHLFQGRYKSAVVEKGPFLLHLASYLHLVPVRGGLVLDATDYRWSSIASYIGSHEGSTGGLDIRPEALETLNQFHEENPGLSYKQHLREMSEAEWIQIGELLRQRVVGSEDFVVSVEEKAQTLARPDGQRPHLTAERNPLMKLFRIFAAVALLLTLNLSAAAGEVEKPKQKMLAKEVAGMVSAASSAGVAVEYDDTAEAAKEMYIPVGEKTKYERVAKASDLKIGDSVQVSYQQVYEENEGKWRILKTEATKVSLLKKAAEQGSLMSGEK